MLSALEPEAKDYRERDTNNLYFRVRATGAKTWQFRYKSNDKWAWLTLGNYPAITAVEARK